jgi:hypothetical protein
MTKTFALLCSLPWLLLLTGCATLFCGPYDVVRVKTNPPDAVVTADGLDRGTTPTQFALRRDQRHLVAIDAPGYKHCEIPIGRTVNGWFFGNLSGWGMLADGLDGAIYSLDPDTISVNLEPIGTNRRHVPAMNPDDQVNIDLTSHQPKTRSKKLAQLERQ